VGDWALAFSPVTLLRPCIAVFGMASFNALLAGSLKQLFWILYLILVETYPDRERLCGIITLTTFLRRISL